MFDRSSMLLSGEEKASKCPEFSGLDVVSLRSELVVREEHVVSDRDEQVGWNDFLQVSSGALWACDS